MKTIAVFTNISDCKHIIDDAVREIVKEQLEKRIAGGMSFDKAKLEPVSFPNGKGGIKKVRCRVAAGRGYLTPGKDLEIRKHSYLSEYDYKHNIYAQNEENTLCLYYELQRENKTERAFRIVGLFELAQLGLHRFSEIRSDNAYNKVEAGRGKNKIQIPLKNILLVGIKVIFIKNIWRN